MSTIAYDLPVADYIDRLSATGHVRHESYKKTSVTIHHNAGNLTHDGILTTWTTRAASAHFDVDAKGAVAQYVKVDEVAWAVGRKDGNESSISIEMADATFGPNWEVSETTWKAAARLAAWLFVHEVKARPNAGNLFPHKHWSSTDCPGPWVSAHFNEILVECQKQYDAFMQGQPSHQPPPAKKSLDEIAREVILGKWGNGPDRVHKLLVAGYDPNAVQVRVNELERGTNRGHLLPLDQIAREVIAGKWGNGPERVSSLTRAGYDAKAVQAEVDALLK